MCDAMAYQSSPVVACFVSLFISYATRKKSDKEDDKKNKVALQQETLQPNIRYKTPSGPLLPRTWSAVRLTSIGSRGFPVAGARIWNTLPLQVTSASSLIAFKQHLKPHLFCFSFPGLSLVWLLNGPCSVCCHFIGHCNFLLMDWPLADRFLKTMQWYLLETWMPNRLMMKYEYAYINININEYKWIHYYELIHPPTQKQCPTRWSGNSDQSVSRIRTTILKTAEI